MDPVILRSLLTIAFGAVAGGVTNAIAVWMLFHPYEPPVLFGRRLRMLQGAIPKNKARLAVSMGRTVGTKLLSPADITTALSEPVFHAAFDERLTSFLVSVFNERRGSIEEMLSPEAAAEVRKLLLHAAEGLLGRLDTYLEGDEFRAQAHHWAEALAHEVEHRPIGELLTEERETALALKAEQWIADAVEEQGFENAVRDYIDRGADRLLQPGRTFQELLPQGLVSAVERGISGYLPIALERLGGLLDDPAARSKVEQVVHELLDRFMKDLRFHQRLVAALIITPDTIDRVIKAIESEGAAKIAEMLHDSSVRDAMARGVNDGIVDFLRKPVISVLGSPEDRSVHEAKDTVQEWVLRLARDTQTRTFLVEKLRSTLSAAEQRTWGDVFRHVPPNRVADVIVGAARSERAREIYRDSLDKLVDTVMQRPLGRFADHLGEDAPARVERALAPPLWDWIQKQVPAVAQQIDIAGKVEAKILDFPPQQVEQLIKGVTERELKVIVRLGYVLGAGIGVVSALISIILS